MILRKLQEKDKIYRDWIVGAFMLVLLFFISCASIVIYIDPLFHYHKPLPGYGYLLEVENERYLNDGIVRNFEYDSIITGSSMTQNFKASEADAVFDADFIKVTFAGGVIKK